MEVIALGKSGIDANEGVDFNTTPFPGCLSRSQAAVSLDSAQVIAVSLCGAQGRWAAHGFLYTRYAQYLVNISSTKGDRILRN